MTNEEYVALKEKLAGAVHEGEAIVKAMEDEMAEAKAKLVEAKRVLRGHCSWGRSVGYEPRSGEVDVVLQLQKGSVYSFQDIVVVFPSATAAQLRRSLETAIAAGTVEKVSHGRYRLV